MEKNQQNIEEMEVLVDELLKKKADPTKIKQLMSKQGLKYKTDPAEQMSQVIAKMNSLYLEQKLNEDFL